jgi:exopolysaccharide biosynthesis polyprenyl glycosylphosphotransferase
MKLSSLAHKLAWLETASTFGVLGLTLFVLVPAGPRAEPPWALGARMTIIAAVCMASLYFNDLYDFDTPHDVAGLFGRLCRALGWSALVLGAVYLAFPALMIPGNLTSYALVALLLALFAMRGTIYTLAKRAPFTQRVLIMGQSALALDLARHIRTRPDLACTVLGFLGDGIASGVLGPRLGGCAEIGAVVRRHRADRLIVALPDRRGTLPVAELLACRVRGLAIEDGIQAYERFCRRLPVEALTPSALIFGDGFRVTRARLAVKRVLSVVIALAALVVAAPVMGLVALLIRLESPGGAFFVQERVGLGGKPFRLIKFRTMRVASRDDEGYLRDNSSRVTRIGRILRKYRLDEIPQFINILRGDMSLVGPRPEIPHIVNAYAAAIPFYNLRHEVRPGLTGWAQVKAGYTMGIEETKRKLCCDLYYIKHLSLHFDLRILFDTVKFVLCGKRPG